MLLRVGQKNEKALTFPLTPITTIFVVILSEAKMVKMAIMDVMEWHLIATNLVAMSFSGKIWKYQTRDTRGTHPPPATVHRLKHLTACLIKNG